MRVLGDMKRDERDRKAIPADSAVPKELFPVEKVLVFGSKTRGESDEGFKGLARRPAQPGVGLGWPCSPPINRSP